MESRSAAVKVHLEDCDKKEIWAPRVFIEEWDELVNDLKRKYGKRLSKIQIVSRAE